MSNLQIIILAIAMSIDAFLVSFSYGLLLNNSRVLNSLKLSISFGLFQFLMPLLGYYAVSVLYKFVEMYSKWIVFIIFAYLAFTFLKNAFGHEKETKITCITFICLICLSLATSIDAFCAGINIRLCNINIYKSSLIIGIITFVNSLTGFWLTTLFKKLPSRLVEIFGASLLIYLAIKTIV